jgi:glycosyltransferase involved in cell wall biosynthesis
MTQTDADKIAIAVIYWGRRGAGVTLMDRIVAGLSEDGRFDVFLSPSLQSEGAIAAGPHVFPIATFSGPISLVWRTLLLPLTVKRLVRSLTAARIEAAVTIMPHLWGWLLQCALRRAGIRTVLMVHDAEPHPGEKRPLFDTLVRREIRGSDRIVTLSDHVADRLIALGIVAEDRISRLFHPILTFDGPASRKKPTGPRRLLFFGRILPYKGVPLLLQAFLRLRQANPDYVLRIVGRGQIAASAALLHQPGVTIDEGWVDPTAIGGILAETDVVLLPYIEASQSGVIAAAYGAGLPVVVTPVGGLTEQVIDGETGIVATQSTATAFAAAIARLFDTPGLYSACERGVARMVETHAPRRFAQALGDVILATLR